MEKLRLDKINLPLPNESDLAPMYFSNFSQSEKLSENKPALAIWKWWEWVKKYTT